MQLLTGEDAAFPGNLFGDTGMVLGYYGGPEAYNVWSTVSWLRFTSHYKIPIWVAGLNGEEEGISAVSALHSLRVPEGKVTILDMEARIDRSYVSNFGHELQSAGYKVWVYGSASSLFRMPQLNGYAVADPTGIVHMYPHPGVRMTQYAFGSAFDNDVVRKWLAEQDDLWI